MTAARAPGLHIQPAFCTVVAPGVAPAVDFTRGLFRHGETLSFCRNRPPKCDDIRAPKMTELSHPASIPSVATFIFQTPVSPPVSVPGVQYLAYKKKTDYILGNGFHLRFHEINLNAMD